MSIHLSRRLQEIANLVPVNARVIDVGTDHAMIPVWLAQTGRSQHIWASDIRAGPLQSAQRLIEETDTGNFVRTRLTDGLQGFGPDDADTVVIAGMGGETMVSILSDAPWTKDGTRLILEPQSKQALLRSWLLENGFSILIETLVKDAGRIYPILVAERGIPQYHTKAELLIGKYDSISSNQLFDEFISVMIQRTSTAAPYDPDAKELLRELLIMKERHTN